MSFVGTNVGALSVKIVALRRDAVTAVTATHQGRPLEMPGQLLAAPEFADAESFGVSGALGNITEVAAIQRAMREIGGEFDAIASLGGESFLVYILANGRIVSVFSHNKCAAGSSEFFVQQIGLMGDSHRRCDQSVACRQSRAARIAPLSSLQVGHHA